MYPQKEEMLEEKKKVLKDQKGQWIRLMKHSMSGCNGGCISALESLC